MPAATSAWPAALAGDACLRPCATAADLVGPPRHGVSRQAAARDIGALAMSSSMSGGSRRGPALDVAVVGGGMVGAAAAMSLARAGFATALLEARPPAPWSVDDEVDLRVVGLAPSSIALLDGLDVWTSIRESRAASYARMHVW